MSPHNLVLSVIGASLLWVGWFGFNAGSAVSAGNSASMAMLVTQIATAAAALSWMVAEWLIAKKPSVLGMISGAIGGLVAITPAAGFVDSLGALFVGIAAGVICYIAAVWLKKALGYDDSLDAWGVHGVGRALGAILTGVFANSAINPAGKGWLVDGNIAQLWPQFISVAAVFVYCGIATFIILKVLDLIIGIRVLREVEIEGLDINLHGETCTIDLGCILQRGGPSGPPFLVGPNIPRKLKYPMQDFELRIFSLDGTLSHSVRQGYLNAIGAIADAKNLAGRAPFEVWAGRRCVYISVASRAFAKSAIA